MNRPAHRRTPKIVALLIVLLAACAPVAAEAPTPTPEIFMPVPDEMRAEVVAREALAAQLGIGMEEIVTREVTPAEWPDSCLGLALPGQACQPGPIPGFRVVLDVETAAYEVRTDLKAETVLVAGRAEPNVGSLIYHFWFMPSVRGYPRAAAQLNNLVMTVTASFTFLPAPGPEHVARSP